MSKFANGVLDPRSTPKRSVSFMEVRGCFYCAPSLADQDLGSRIPFIKSAFYGVLKKDSWDLVTERNATVHGRERRLVESAYSKVSMKRLEAQVDIVVQKFLSHLNAQNGQPVNLSIWFQLFTIGGYYRLTSSTSANQHQMCSLR